MRVAAIDVGTNSTRLLVADVGTECEPIERQMTITRLGYQVDETGQLDPDSMNRTVEVITRYAKIANELGAKRLRIAATSACRDASNRDEFFARVMDASGVLPEILSGTEEAATAFKGATTGLTGLHLVVDIGGGSTELVLGETSVISSISIDMGCVRLTERYLKTDPPTMAEIDDAVGAIEQGLERAEVAIDAAAASQVIGVAGTVTTLAAISLGLSTYDPSRTHHYEMPASEVRRLFQALVEIPASERIERFGVVPGRADVIVAGSLILRSILDRWAFDGVLVSESDILDGLVLSMGPQGNG